MKIVISKITNCPKHIHIVFAINKNDETLTLEACVSFDACKDLSSQDILDLAWTTISDKVDVWINQQSIMKDLKKHVDKEFIEVEKRVGKDNRFLKLFR